MRQRFSSMIKSQLFCLKQRLSRSKTYAYYRELAVNQWRSSDEIMAINWRKRKRLLQYAYERVPFYRQRFESLALLPGDVREPSDWNSVPILTKKHLVLHFKDLKSADATNDDCRPSTTGGSTGEPVKVLHDARVPLDGLAWRVLRWWGLSPGTDEARAWRMTTPPVVKRNFSPRDWLRANRLLLDASNMTADALDHFLLRFNRLRPPLLQGYVGAISHLANYVEANALPIHRPRAVWVTSSPVSSVERSLIERVFRAPVYDQYGCCEVYWLAAECKQRDGMHMFADARHIEFLDDCDNPCEVGENGRIVITDLENYVFPLIRYENGDVGHQLNTPCACGVNLPLMGAVKGRMTDNFRMPDGTVISGEYLTTIFDDHPEAVRAFQIVQKGDHQIVIRVVPHGDETESKNALKHVQACVVNKTCNQVPVRVEFVKEIPSDRGKTRYVISDLL